MFRVSCVSCFMLSIYLLSMIYLSCSGARARSANFVKFSSPPARGDGCRRHNLFLSILSQLKHHTLESLVTVNPTTSVWKKITNS